MRIEPFVIHYKIDLPEASIHSDIGHRTHIQGCISWDDYSNWTLFIHDTSLSDDYFVQTMTEEHPLQCLIRLCEEKFDFKFDKTKHKIVL